MIGPSYEQKEGVDDPDAVFLEEVWRRQASANESLHQIVKRAERTDCAPEPTDEYEDNRNQGPPQNPHQGRAQILLGDVGANEQLVGH
jgi:hypothetical protein